MALKGWTQTIFFFHNQVTATITGLNLQDGRGFRQREIKYIQMPPFGELPARSSATSTSSTARKIYLRWRTCTSKCCTLIASKHRRQLVPLKEDGKFHLRIVPFLLLKKLWISFLSMSWYRTWRRWTPGLVMLSPTSRLEGMTQRVPLLGYHYNGLSGTQDLLEPELMLS